MGHFRFTLRQLLGAIALLFVGLGCLIVDPPSPEWPSHPAHDAIDTLESAARVVIRVVGGVSIVFGVILLLTQRQRLRTLIYSLCGAMCGFFIAAPYAPSVGKADPGPDYRTAVFVAFLAVGAACGPLVVRLIRIGKSRNNPSNVRP